MQKERVRYTQNISRKSKSRDIYVVYMVCGRIRDYPDAHRERPLFYLLSLLFNAVKASDLILRGKITQKF